MRDKNGVLILLMGVIHLNFQAVLSRGRLWEPPARSTMWRRGFTTPINFDDRSASCGGKKGIKCGVCGDDLAGVPENEAGGKYATGQISRTYHEHQRVTFQVDLPGHDKGYIEFKICPVDQPGVKETQDCFDQNRVHLPDSASTRAEIDSDARIKNIEVQLPDHLVCNFCVLQWHFHGSRSTSKHSEGEENCTRCYIFVDLFGCSDIRIIPSNSINQAKENEINSAEADTMGQHAAEKNYFRINETSTKSEAHLGSSPFVPTTYGAKNSKNSNKYNNYDYFEKDENIFLFPTTTTLKKQTTVNHEGETDDTFDYSDNIPSLHHTEENNSHSVITWNQTHSLHNSSAKTIKKTHFLPQETEQNVSSSSLYEDVDDSYDKGFHRHPWSSQTLRHDNNSKTYNDYDYFEKDENNFLFPTTTTLKPQTTVNHEGKTVDIFDFSENIPSLHHTEENTNHSVITWNHTHSLHNSSAKTIKKTHFLPQETEQNISSSSLYEDVDDSYDKGFLRHPWISQQLIHDNNLKDNFSDDHSTHGINSSQTVHIVHVSSEHKHNSINQKSKYLNATSYERTDTVSIPSWLKPINQDKHRKIILTTKSNINYIDNERGNVYYPETYYDNSDEEYDNLEYSLTKPERIHNFDTLKTLNQNNNDNFYWTDKSNIDHTDNERGNYPYHETTHHTDGEYETDNLDQHFAELERIYKLNKLKTQHENKDEHRYWTGVSDNIHINKKKGPLKYREPSHHNDDELKLNNVDQNRYDGTTWQTIYNGGSVDSLTERKDDVNEYPFGDESTQGINDYDNDMNNNEANGQYGNGQSSLLSSLFFRVCRSVHQNKWLDHKCYVSCQLGHCPKQYCTCTFKKLKHLVVLHPVKILGAVADDK